MSTILLVEDEQDTLELFADVLKQMNHRLLTARDGDEALAVARRTQLDLVVTDGVMPRMGGLELCHRLHADARLRSVPVILHNSPGDPDVPGVQFVSKGYLLDKFQSLVSWVLASSEGPHTSWDEPLETDGTPRSSGPHGPQGTARLTTH